MNHDHSLTIQNLHKLIVQALDGADEGTRQLYQQFRVQEIFTLRGSEGQPLHVIAQVEDQIVCFDPRYDELCRGSIENERIEEWWIGDVSPFAEQFEFYLESLGDAHEACRQKSARKDKQYNFILSRELRTREGKSVFISISAPEKMSTGEPDAVERSAEWECVIKIEGLGEPQLRPSRGIDSIGCIGLAMQVAFLMLRDSGKLHELVWVDSNGTPVARYGDTGLRLERHYPSWLPPSFEKQTEAFIDEEIDKASDFLRLSHSCREDTRSNQELIDEILHTGDPANKSRLFHILLDRYSVETFALAEQLFQSDDKQKRRLGRAILRRLDHVKERFARQAELRRIHQHEDQISRRIEAELRAATDWHRSIYRRYELAVPLRIIKEGESWADPGEWMYSLVFQKSYAVLYDEKADAFGVGKSRRWTLSGWENYPSLSEALNEFAIKIGEGA